jgi:hypothetical protein
MSNDAEPHAPVEVQKQAISDVTELAEVLQALAPVEEEGTPSMDKPHANHVSSSLDSVYEPTPDSVAAARAAQERERAEFTRSTGMRLDRNGQLRRSSLRVHPERAQQH